MKMIRFKINSANFSFSIVLTSAISCYLISKHCLSDLDNMLHLKLQIDIVLWQFDLKQIKYIQIPLPLFVNIIARYVGNINSLMVKVR